MKKKKKEEEKINRPGEMSQDELFKREVYFSHTSLFYLNRHILGFPDLLVNPHEEMCDFVQYWTPGIDRKLILISRDCFKTTCVSIGLPIFTLLEDPNETCLIVGQERNYATHILGLIRTLMTSNEKLIAINGGPFRGLHGWRPEEIFIVGRTDTISVQPSIGTAGIDGIHPGPHYGLIIIDDGESEKNTETESALEKLIRNYKYLSPMVRRPTATRRGGRVVIIGTPYNLLGLYYYILESKEENKHFDIILGQAEKDTAILPEVKGERVPVTLPHGPEGTLLFKKRLTKEFLDDSREKDPLFHNSQYQISLTAGLSTEFKKDWFRYYLQKELPEILKIYCMLDPAISTKSTADYTSILTIGQDNFDNAFVLDLLRARIGPDEIIDYFYKIYIEHRCYKMGIETNGFQFLLKWQFDKEAKKRGFLPIWPLPHYDKSKANRIRALIPHYKKGKIYHLAADEDKNRVHDSQRALESELLIWSPKRKSHDDILDTEAMWLELSLPLEQRKDRGMKHSSSRKASSRRSGY